VLDGELRLLPRGTSEVAVRGDIARAALRWGNFTTHADIALRGSFAEGISSDSGAGTVLLTLLDADLQSGSGGKQGWAAHLPQLDLDADLKRAGGALSGRAALRVGHAEGRIGSTALSADLNAAFDLAGLDLAQRTARGSGSVSIRNVALPHTPDPVSNWWADVKLDTVFGHAGEGLDIGSSFRAELRDATPGMAVLAKEGFIPEWLTTTFPLRGISLTGSLARRCRLTDIRVVNLNGGPATARGRVQIVPEGFQGALLLRLAAIPAVSAGLDFDAGKTHLGMFEGDAWLARFNQAFDRGASDVAARVCPSDETSCTSPEAADGTRGAEARQELP
jgi:hypothetical protein